MQLVIDVSNAYVSKLGENDCKRCTVDIRIMVGHYVRDEIFLFWCHFTRSGSLRLADWSLLISFYVSR